MLSSLKWMKGLNLLIFEARKVMIIINISSGSLHAKDGLPDTNNPDFLQPLKRIPAFCERKGVIRVCTYMGILSSAPSKEAAKLN